MIKASVNEAQFKKIFQDYLKFTTRSVQESLDAKNYFITTGALNATERVDKGKIASDLSAASRKNGKVRLGNILVNFARGKKGQKGLQGAKMEAAYQRLLAQRQRRSGTLARSWLKAVKDLNPYVKSKGGIKPNITGQPLKGKAAGYAESAQSKGQNWRGIIRSRSTNTLANAGTKFYAKLSAALAASWAKETASMVEYISKKLSKYNK